MNVIQLTRFYPKLLEQYKAGKIQKKDLPIALDHIEKYNVLYKKVAAKKLPNPLPADYVTSYDRLIALYKSGFTGLVQYFAYRTFNSFTNNKVHLFIKGFQNAVANQVNINCTPKICKM
jgi:hypothetical protein